MPKLKSNSMPFFQNPYQVWEGERRQPADLATYLQSIKSEAWEKNGMTRVAKFNYTKLTFLMFFF